MEEAEINGEKISVISTVDAVGLFCPMPVVKLKLAMEKVGLNQVIGLLADDPGVLEDLPAWCRETNNKLLSLSKNQSGVFIAYIEKRGE